MKEKILIKSDEFDLLAERAYHYLMRYNLDETCLEQIKISFNLDTEEILKLEKKIEKINCKWYVNSELLSKLIIGLRYKSYKDKDIPFDEESPLAVF